MPRGGRRKNSGPKPLHGRKLSITMRLTSQVLRFLRLGGNVSQATDELVRRDAEFQAWKDRQ